MRPIPLGANGNFFDLLAWHDGHRQRFSPGNSKGDIRRRHDHTGAQRLVPRNRRQTSCRKVPNRRTRAWSPAFSLRTTVIHNATTCRWQGFARQMLSCVRPGGWPKVDAHKETEAVVRSCLHTNRLRYRGAAREMRKRCTVVGHVGRPPPCVLSPYWAPYIPRRASARQSVRNRVRDRQREWTLFDMDPD